MNYIKNKIYVVLILLSLYSCSTLNTILNQMNIQKPTVKITNAKISKLSSDNLNCLDSADSAFKICDVVAPKTFKRCN